MTDNDPPETSDPNSTSEPQTPPAPKKGRVRAAMDVADRASTTVEAAGSAFNAIKWVAIAIVALVVFGSGFAIYKVLSKPVVMAGDAVESVTGAVKSGSEKVAVGAADLKNRLVIPVADQDSFDIVADDVFARLVALEETEPDGMKDRIFRRANFPGSENRICALQLDFGNGALPVYLAADNKAYGTASALGSNDDRLMRFVIRTGSDDVEMNAEWDAETSDWVLKWKATTVKKSVNDTVAAERIRDILLAAKEGC